MLEYGQRPRMMLRSETLRRSGVNFEKMENVCLIVNLNNSCMLLQTTVNKDTHCNRLPARDAALNRSIMKMKLF